MDTSQLTFGTWVRLRRQALALTCEELASQVGCAEVTIRMIEADTHQPASQVAESLAAHLGIPTEYHQLFAQVARGIVAVDQLPPPIPTPPMLGSLPAHSFVATPALPSGTITFLFTDIEGSTRRWEEQPDAMRVALARHDTLMHAAIASGGGHVFKTMGDAFCSAFDSAPAALAAAVAGQRALAGEAWGVVGPLRVRMALHTGTAAPQGSDYFGQPLNRVARLLGVGHGGQILLSMSTRELVRDTLPAEITLDHLGIHRLKDLIRPEPIFQATMPGLPANFPPLKSLDPRTTNLPAPINELIGRSRELRELIELVRNTRLVTLTGTGGTGKTRLALQVGTEQLEHYADGVWFVDLAPVSDAQQIATTIAHILGMPEVPADPIQERMVRWLRERNILLILDNCEQIVEEAASLTAALLRSAPRLRILATSRIPLRITAEHEYAVAPLGLPDPGIVPSLNHLSQYDALALFIARARAVRADFTITTANAPVVAEICTRLDGLPLAIELAAARIRLFPPEQLLSRLISARMQTLIGGARDLPARQQTIRATIDWSYRLLTSAHQMLFARLGIFVGGWTLAAAEAVGSDPHLNVLEGVAALLEQNLVHLIETIGEPHYTMLETIRAYALERLQETDTGALVAQRHAAYFLSLAETIAPRLERSRQSHWLQQLDAEYGNLRAVLLWAFDGGDAVLGCQLIGALAGTPYSSGFWLARGYAEEGLHWLEQALTSSTLGSILRAKLLIQLASLRWNIFQDVAQADPPTMAALELFQAAGDTTGSAQAQVMHGFYLSASGRDPVEAIQCFESGLALYQNLDDWRGIAAVLHLLGDAVGLQGDLVRALALLEQSVALLRQLDASEGELALTLTGLGDVVRQHGDTVRAQALYQEAIELCCTIGDTHAGIWPLRGLIEIAVTHRGHEQVLTMVEDHVDQIRAQQDQYNLLFVLHLLGALVSAQGQTARGATLLLEALHKQKQMGKGSILDEGLQECARIAARQGQWLWATRMLGAIMEPDPVLKATVRDALPGAAFDAAWVAGQALTWEQAADEACIWLEHIANGT